MLDSVRARLTLWYTGVLALILIAFALVAYFFLSFTLNQRTDDSLAGMANAFASTLTQEEKDLEGRGEVDAARSEEDRLSPDAAATEAVSEYQLRDYQFVVYDDARRVVAASPGFTTERGSGGTPLWTLAPVASGISKLLDAVAQAPDAAPHYATLSDGDDEYRAAARRARTRSREYTLVVLRSLHDQEDLLEGAGGALFIAVPLALLLASVGGYFLARKSLAPVVAMGDTAAHISAANLHERLPVANERDELGRLATVFNNLLARLDESFEQQRRFMADASHELRTPVAIVRGEAEVALSQPARSEDDYRESLAIVHDEGRRLTRVVEDLFTLARADAGQYRLVRQDFYLDELAAECCRAVRTLIAERGLTLLCDAPREMPFRGDEELLRRLLLNLLDNAIKNTPPGGSVAVACEHQANEYRVAVTDTGAGIPAEAQPHIFERFYRADKARTRSAGGAGLGLAIARWIAEVHSGRLELLRSDETGSAFLATLPAPGAP